MADSDTTTAKIYELKLLYLASLFGPKVKEYLDKLRLGKYCEKEKQNLIDISWGMEILNKYDTADIALDDAVNNKFTLTEMEQLMETIYIKLL